MNLAGTIRYATIEQVEEVNEVVLLQEEIWGVDTVSPLPQLIASIHHGGVIIGAFLDKQLIGFCYGFPGFKNGENYLISHMAGIRSAYQNYGIGFQLKLRQREWAMDYGYRKIVWTFDPLEVRNGYFNLSKLGACSTQYVSSYYGEMKDKLNQGLPADRLIIEWDIGSKRVESILSGILPVKHEVSYEVWPDEGEAEGYAWQQGYLVPAPANIQILKKTSPEQAMVWRMSLRNILSKALQHGYILTGVQKKPNSDIHFYILEQQLEDIRD